MIRSHGLRKIKTDSIGCTRRKLSDQAESLLRALRAGIYGELMQVFKKTAGSGADESQSLPDATLNINSYIGVIRIDAGSANVIVQPVNGQTINGFPNYILSNQWQFVILYGDGLNWLIFGGN